MAQGISLILLVQVSPKLAMMADWVVATERQNLVVGMGLRNSFHSQDSSLK